VLAGIHHGLTHQLEPPPVTTGNAYDQPGEPLPIGWGEAIERFAHSDVARRYFGEKFVNLYCTVKRGELQDFAAHVTPLEIARYLGPL
jgi:glutamine synthetase